MVIRRLLRDGYTPNIHTHTHTHAHARARNIGFPTRYVEAVSRAPRYTRNIYPLPFSKHHVDHNVARATM